MAEKGGLQTDLFSVENLNWTTCQAGIRLNDIMSETLAACASWNWDRTGTTVVCGRFPVIDQAER